MESTLILAFLFTAPGAFADSATPATATPQFALPSYPGKSIEVMVPATLDLAARAELALRAIGGLDCTLIIKGSTVVRMEPGGILNPFYQREHYRQNETLWLSKKVFIADSVLEW